jgi:hypothetical protein
LSRFNDFARTINVELDRQRGIDWFELIATPQTLAITIGSDQETRIRVPGMKSTDGLEHQRPIAVDFLVSRTG